MEFIKEGICKQILFIGQALNDKGGIATVERSFRSLFHPYNHIAVYSSTSQIRKCLIFTAAIVRVFCKLLSRQIKCVHINTASGKDFYRNSIFIILAYLFRKKIILHIHGGYFGEFYRRHTTSLKFFFAKTTAVVVVSNFLYNELTRMKIHNDIHCIYNVLEKPKIVVQKKYSQDSENLKLLFLGKICKNKGLWDILYTISNNTFIKEHIELHIAGAGEVETLHSLIQKCKLQNVVIEHGWVSGKDKTHLMMDCDVLIQPSYFESFGLSIAEGMSYGLPAISSRVGGIPEVVQHGKNGLLITSGCIGDIEKSIEFFIGNRSALKEMGQAAQNSVTKFYINNIKKEWEFFYSKILEDV